MGVNMKIRVLLLLCTCILVVGVLSGCKDKAVETEGETYLIFSSESTALNTMDKSLPLNESTNAGNSFSVMNNGEIYNLISRFNTDIMNDNLSSAMSYTDIFSDYDTTAFEKEASYITGMQNLQCYVVNGMIDGTYVVVSSRNVEIEGIESPLIDVDFYYICTDESGNLYIDGTDVSDDVSSYNSIVVQNQTIQDMVISAQKSNKQYMTDSNLDTIIPGNTPKFLYELQ